MLKELVAFFSSETPLKALVLEARDESRKYPEQVVQVALGEIARYRVDAHFNNTYWRKIEIAIEAFIDYYQLDRNCFKVTRTYGMDTHWEERVLVSLTIKVYPYGRPDDEDMFVRVNSGADTED